MTWLAVGLGNPGPQYTNNRHNIGFMVLDELAKRGCETFRDKFNGKLTKARFGPVDAWLLKPMTFMNRSGTSVGSAGSFYNIAPERTVVVHDELDIPFGHLRVKVGGGHGGHNGLRSIFAHFGRDFIRVRCGVGRPPHGDVTGHVLGNFDADQAALLDGFISQAADAVDTIFSEGAVEAMNRFNGTAPSH